MFKINFATNKRDILLGMSGKKLTYFLLAFGKPWLDGKKKTIQPSLNCWQSIDDLSAMYQ